MHRNRENHVAPQVSPDISLQTEEKKNQKYGPQDRQWGSGLTSQKISFGFFAHSKLAFLGSLRKSMWSSDV